MSRVIESSREHRGMVAVVEDDASLNQAIVRQLRAAGFRTCSFDCGQAVIENGIARADCFVLDVHLPDMSGFDLVRTLGVRTPIVVITAHDDPMHRRAAKDIGAVAYLTKPFGRESLLNAVDLAIHSR